MERRHEVLFNQLHAFREETLQMAESLSEEAADIIPEGFNNNIRWNLGHIYVDQYLWIKHLIKEPIEVPDGFHEWSGFGTSPADWDKQPPSLDFLKQLLGGQIDAIRMKYGNRLDMEYQKTEYDMQTIAEVLVRTIYHEALHTETIKGIKRFI